MDSAVSDQEAEVNLESNEPAETDKDKENANGPDTEENEEETDKLLLELMTVEEYIEENGKLMIEFEVQMFKDLSYTDALVVCGKGISYEKVLLNLLKIHCDPRCLVLVINADDFEEKYYTKLLGSRNIHQSSTNAVEREKVYLEGGIHFISTRILVVDLLKKRIPVEHITGIIVLRAHEVIESCQEAFALRLYRQRNKTGFIKAFTLSVEAFTMGYGHVDRVMRNLFVRELFLWPRYHALIQKTLKPFEPILHELYIPMSEKLTRIQNHMLDLMNFQLREVKRINPSLELEEVTVENCVNKKFQKILHAQLDTVWHQLSAKTKLLMTDLNILRSLLFSAIYGDAVSFYSHLKKYRTQDYVLSSSGWTLLKPAEEIFKLAKQRVFNSKDQFEPEPPSKWKAITEILKVEIPNDIKEQVKNPKVDFNRNTQIKVLILCNDARTCYQLNQFLVQGEERSMFYSAMKCEVPVQKLSDKYKKLYSGGSLKDTVQVKDVKSTTGNKSEKPGPSKLPKPAKEPLVVSMLKGRKRNAEDQSDARDEEASVDETETSELDKDLFEDIEEECFRNSYVLTMSQKIDGNESICAADFDITRLDEMEFELCPDMGDLDVTSVVATLEKPMVFIQTFKSQRNKLSTLDHTLLEMKPDYIILYNINVTAIRQIEIFEARLQRPRLKRLKVFTLLHSKTVEEQSFLTSLRREKEAFEFLIETKKKMVIPEYQDGKTEDALMMLKKNQAVVSTRQAGGQEQPGTSKDSSMVDAEGVIPKVIVDMREFRSDLPCLIHRRGIQVVPLTISIGDYILTPDICVERKSISDLVGSLNSGRLYTQCIQMSRFYSKPILLIEFDQDKPFHLQKNFKLSTDSVTSSADIVQKLQLLTIHFPKLRIVWSPSPWATAQLFEEMKENKEEPNPDVAVQLGSEDPTQEFDAILEKFNTNIHDFLLKMPGITSKNINAVMKKGGSLKNLLKMSEEELTEMLGNSKNAKALWDALHLVHKPSQATEQTQSGYKYYKEKKFRKF